MGPRLRAAVAVLLGIAPVVAQAADGGLVTLQGRHPVTGKADSRGDIAIAPLPEPGTAVPPNLLRLAAAHAALAGPASPASADIVTRLYAYQRAKAAALGMPARNAAELEARAAALGRADALLELVADRPLPADAIAAVDAALGLATADHPGGGP